MKNDNQSQRVKGIGFCGLLTLIFITLKLIGKIPWSWTWVLAPMWIPIALLLLILMILLIVLGVKEMRK
ncbi:MAG: hypothetical protein RSG59_08215 [Ruthenibacterium sp.]